MEEGVEDILEGVLEVPDQRVKVFNNLKELTKFLQNLNSKVIQITTSQDMRYILQWLPE